MVREGGSEGVERGGRGGSGERREVRGKKVVGGKHRHTYTVT